MEKDRSLPDGLRPGLLQSADEPVNIVANALAGLLAQQPYTYKNQWFFKQDIALDGYVFENCKFEGCTLLVTRGTFRLSQCSLSGCKVVYGEGALNIVKLFQSNLPPPFRTGGPALLPTFDADGRITVG